MAEPLREDGTQYSPQPPSGIGLQTTGNDEENMTNVRHMLVERMDPDSGLIDNLLQLRALTYPETVKIKNEKVIFDRNEKLLEQIFIERRQQALMAALTDTGQQHLVNFVRGNGVHREEYGTVWPLLKRQTDILDVNRLNLVQVIDPCDLITRMFSKGVLSDRQQRYINSLHGDIDKAEAMLDILRRGSEENYWKTVACLRESIQEHVAEILEDGGVLVQSHVTNEGDPAHVNEEEDRIVEALANILQNATLPQYQRIRERLDLRIMRAKKDQSIVFYFYCKTLEELSHLHQLLTKEEFKQNIAEVFDLLTTRRETRVSTVNWSEEEFTKAKTYFEKANRQPESEDHEMKLKLQMERDEASRQFLLRQTQPEADRQPESEDYEMKLKLQMEHDEASRQFLIRQTQPAIYGLAILKDEVFISYLQSPVIDVYDSTTFQLKHHLKVDGLTNPEHIVSCNIYYCLYSFDWSYRGKTSEILRIDPHTGKVIKNWKTFEGGGRLSVANDTNIILNINHRNQLNEYTADGELLRRINLASGTDIVRAWHAIKLDSGLFLVCHGDYDDPKSRVCMMSIRENDRRFQKGFDAKVVKAFGDKLGNLLKCPVYMDVDKEGSILVCDTATSRLLMLNSSLEEPRQLNPVEDATPMPWRVCVDDSHGRYLMADYNRIYACKVPRDGKTDWKIVLDKTTSTT